MLYTKSDNVDHLLNLAHNGHTIISWTVSCNTVAREIEKQTPTMEERVQAAVKCQKAGYTVRFRFSPIIPIKNWQAENREMIEKLFAKVKKERKRENGKTRKRDTPRFKAGASFKLRCRVKTTTHRKIRQFISTHECGSFLACFL